MLLMAAIPSVPLHTVNGASGKNTTKHISVSTDVSGTCKVILRLAALIVLLKPPALMVAQHQHCFPNDLRLAQTGSQGFTSMVLVSNRS